MMKPFWIVPLLLAVASAQAQEAYWFERGGASRAIDCASMKGPLAGGKTETLCYAPRSGLPLRCADLTAESLDEFCRQAQADSNAAASDRVAAIGRDVASGTSRGGGRRATQERCLPGLPEGFLLLPTDQLRLDPTASAVAQLVEVVIAEEGGSQAIAASIPSVGAGGTVIDANDLRGRAWVLRGRADGTPFLCKIRVIDAAEARTLKAHFQPLQRPGRAALLEQAAFFRSNRLTYEYWRAVESARNP
ncbi:MAG: hypothetical protein ING59_10805 [Burkholderiales bacterium]|jgi:hypothetical protein|nr:hypothetical protein [Burkholderiales bacterium]